MNAQEANKSANFEEIWERYRKWIKKVEEYDKFRRSKESIQNIANWLLALSGGTFLWFINSFNKFIINNSIAFKQLYLCTLILLLLSIVALVLNRILLYMRQLGIDASMDVLDSLPRKLELMVKDSNMNIEEIERTYDTKVEQAINLYAKSHNLITHWGFIIKFGVFLYLASLVLLTSYVILFLINI